MTNEIREEAVRLVLSFSPRPSGEIKREAVVKVTSAGSGDGSEKKQPVRVSKSDKIGPNDPCPCGSGKKYKKCCGDPRKRNAQ